MGPPTISEDNYLLVISGLVAAPYALTLPQLQALPSTTVTAFMECYGSPLVPPTAPCRRVGNASWTGVRLVDLLALAGEVGEAATHVWSSGLDSGRFAGHKADRYQKDVTLKKARAEETLVAWAMNGEVLERYRGGPVRLVVPGWFGTNSTKWLCRIEVREGRCEGIFTRELYNEVNWGELAKVGPVWEVEVNAIITSPQPGERVGEGRDPGVVVYVSGWAWSADGVERVEVSVDGGESWQGASVRERGTGWGWQGWAANVLLQDGQKGACTLLARATSKSGVQQPLKGRRNAVHRVKIEVEP